MTHLRGRGMAVFAGHRAPWRWLGLALVLLVLGPVLPGGEGPAAAQDPPWQRGPVMQAAPVPFGPGELMRYQAKLGPVPVGEGYMAVHGIELVRGYQTYHLTMGVRGGIPLARVNDQQDSWLDVNHLISRRFIQDLHQVRYKRYREWEIFPEQGYWEQSDLDDPEEMTTDLPLDDISFVYYVRSLPLEVGDVYVFDRYFRDDGNPVVIEVVRRDTVEVPAGTFETIVVRPTIKTSGLFGEGGEAEIHFSDDDRRLLVQLKSRIPVVGHLSLHLKEMTAGRPLRRWTASSREDEAAQYRDDERARRILEERGADGDH